MKINQYKKGQVSTELIIIIGAVLLFFVPLMLTIYFKTNEANDQIAELQAQLLAVRLASLSNSIGNLGPGSSMITEVYLPRNIKSLKLKSYESGSELILSISSSQGSKEIVELIKFPTNEFEIQNYEGMARFEIFWEGEKISLKRLP